MNRQPRREKRKPPARELKPEARRQAMQRTLKRLGARSFEELLSADFEPSPKPRNK